MKPRGVSLRELLAIVGVGVGFFVLLVGAFIAPVVGAQVMWGGCVVLVSGVWAAPGRRNPDRRPAVRVDPRLTAIVRDTVLSGARVVEIARLLPLVDDELAAVVQQLESEGWRP